MPSHSYLKGKQPECPIHRAVISGSTSLVHNAVQSPMFMDKPAMVPALLHPTQVMPLDDMAPKPSIGLLHTKTSLWW